MIRIEKNEVFSTEGKSVRRVGTDVVFRRGGVLPGDTADLFEEIDEVPAYSKTEYDDKVNELVRRRYSESEEFAIQRKMLNTLMTPAPLSDDAIENAVAEYDAYNAYVEQCKLDAPQEIADDKARMAAERVNMSGDTEI